MVFGVMEAVTFFVRVLPAAALSSLILLVAIILPAYASVPAGMDLRHLIERMESAYAEVNDYQTKVHVEAGPTDGTYHTETFLYNFEKPDRIRVDFESPHSGLVLVYPDKNGKAVVRPFQWAPFFKLHLDPNSSLLDTWFFQQSRTPPEASVHTPRPMNEAAATHRIAFMFIR
jgi:hypothetical protein